MTDRQALLEAFLAKTSWAEARRAPLAGDASNRRYLRLHLENGETAVLMDAPPEKDEDVRPFVRVSEDLRSARLSSPRILAQDTEAGFLLLEDLGDGLFARVVSQEPSLERILYTAATDVLLALHDAPVRSDLPAYSPDIMTEMAALSYRWYLGGLGFAFEEGAARFKEAFKPLLEATAGDSDVLIQRDYHAENLLWLPDREGIKRVGLLDYQDAMAGHRAYDLVSLLQDARRDVPVEIEEEMLNHYTQASDCDQSAFRTAYHVLGAQRNLRIIGVFARLSLHSAKPHYVDYIPRVWSYLLRDLDHPANATIRPIILETLPEPTQAHLRTLREKCGTIPIL